VIARCSASAAFAAALPGKAWLDRGPDTPAGAYAIFTLERDGEPEWFSDGSYLQGFTLRMVAYTVQGLVVASTPQAVQLGMADALNKNPTTWDALRDGRVNCGLPASYDGKHEPQLRGGKDVFAAAGQWRMLIDGNLNP
jgi:hypothetical protein